MNKLTTDLKSLHEATLNNLKSSKANNTLRAYKSDFKDFGAFCAKHGYAYYLFHGNRLVDSQDARGVLVCAAVWSDHIYLYRLPPRSHAALRRISIQPQTRIANWRLRTDKETTPPEDLQWHSVGEPIRPGCWKVHGQNMEDLRLEMLRARRSPMVALSGPHDIQKLTYVFSSLDQAQGSATFYRYSDDSAAIEKFYAALHTTHGLNLKYTGEGIPAATCKAIFALLRQPRAPTAPANEKRRDDGAASK